ncbi:Cro/CI family transcriptional regulator [Phytobacter sp. RSE-02]|uniref:Cro/CI family transcriptional regulator n=1 Tax=Phytobacter sp. RSE-02 TaxID=3229229 RepID=UPI00339D4918
MNKSIVVDFYGSQRAIATALGVSDQAVSNWGDVIPKGAALELEKITNGALICDLSLYKGRQRKNKRVQQPEA